MAIIRSLVTLLSLLAACAISAPVADPSAAASPEVAELEARAAAGYKNIAYFVNWAIYGRNYQPQQLPYKQLTHVLYAFANVNSSGGIVLSDTYADTDKHYPTDSWNDVGTNVYGCVKQLYLLKKANPALKVLLSIGGWTYSPNFAAPMATAAGRTQFAQSAINLVENLGFDGIDIDWEYPANSGQADNFVSLLSEVRSDLTALQTKYGTKSPFQITVAMPAGPSNYQQLHLSQMNSYVDLFNLMAYDYAGSFSNVSGYDDNLYPLPSNPGATPFNTDQAVKYYLANGVPANKLILGLPLYGRAFTGTAGMGKPFTGVGAGSWEAGVYDYKVLPLAGATEIVDNTAVGMYSWDPSQQMIVSYDNKAVAQTKTSYITSKGLGGAMFWESSGDRNDTGSLISTLWSGLSAKGAMDTIPNTLSYPGSMYANLQAGMPS